MKGVCVCVCCIILYPGPLVTAVLLLLFFPPITVVDSMDQMPLLHKILKNRSSPAVPKEFKAAGVMPV